jgi:hypothetical protein
MELKLPKVLPFMCGIIGLLMGASYYLSIMISQFFIGRPSSTWILGIFWLPIFVLKPGLVGFLIGLLFGFFHHFFYHQRTLLPSDIKIIKVSMILLCCFSAIAGVIKIVQISVQQ